MQYRNISGREDQIDQDTAYAEERRRKERKELNYLVDLIRELWGPQNIRRDVVQPFTDLVEWHLVGGILAGWKVLLLHLAYCQAGPVAGSREWQVLFKKVDAFGPGRVSLGSYRMPGYVTSHSLTLQDECENMGSQEAGPMFGGNQ